MTAKFNALDSDSIEDDYKEEFSERLLCAVENNVKKSNRKSILCILAGQRKARIRQFEDAAEYFNSSLRMARKGSTNFRKAYLGRGECFSQRNLFANAAVDVDLAMNYEPPAKLARKNEKSKHDSSTDFVPKLSFEARKSFPSMAKTLTIDQNSKFGRFITAKCDMNVGQTIMVADIFASAAYSHRPKRTFCLTCQKTDTNFIPCKHCSSVMFCSYECRNSNDVHRLECGSIFHQITNAKLKLAIQMVLVAIKHFENSEAFIDFVESVLAGRHPNHSFLQYQLVLRLDKYQHKDDIYLLYQAFEILMTIPVMKIWFHSESKEQFLRKLLLCHMGIIRTNGFEEHIGSDQGIELSYIYDAISLFNHSCAPNAFYSRTYNKGYLVVVRPIKRGEQIFINYLGKKKRK